MNDQWQFLLNRIGELLWVKPLIMCVLSIAAALLASVADMVLSPRYLPEISIDSIKTLLTVISSSMLVIATFAVGSMVSAYASASAIATPRSFALIVADDVSQNALSAFIGAFIFSIVGLIALLNGYYDKAGRFTLFVLTLLVFAIVIITFVRWVDRIARLGRLETAISCVEKATVTALDNWRFHPNLGGVAIAIPDLDALPVFADRVGYVQHIKIAYLQKLAQDFDAQVEVVALPGSFIGPSQVIAYVRSQSSNANTSDIDLSLITKAFRIGDERTFDEDPRFGLVVLSEIASRALSSGINDAGTAIQVIGTLVRIFGRWGEVVDESRLDTTLFDRVVVTQLSTASMFNDAFHGIARDGADMIEVVSRLQQGLQSLAECDNDDMREAACEQALQVLARAEMKLTAKEDLLLARELTQFALPS